MKQEEIIDLFNKCENICLNSINEYIHTISIEKTSFPDEIFYIIGHYDELGGDGKYITKTIYINLEDLQ